MVTQFIHSDSGHVDSILQDYDFLEAAMINPGGTEWAYLKWHFQSFGVTGTASVQLRKNAQRVLARHGESLPESTRSILSRLALAKIRQPNFGQYISPPGLLLSPDVRTRSSSVEIANATLARATEVYETLLELPQLKNHDDFTRLEINVRRVVAQCGALMFGQEHASRFSTPIDDVNVLEHGLLLPETAEPMELVFMAINSVGDLLFGSAATLLERAIDRVAHHQAMLAAVDVHYAMVVERPLLFSNRCLVSMTQDTWLKIRPAIENPGAVQGDGFRQLTAAYDKLRRLKDHARYPEHEQPFVPLLTSLLTDAETLLQLWKNQHLAIAGSYTKGGSEGLDWLKKQVERSAVRIAHNKADGSGPHNDGVDGCTDPIEPEAVGRANRNDLSTNKNRPTGGGCPFGY